MGEMEDKINTVLSNPQLMQQIMTMAQSLSGSQEPQNRDIAPPVPMLPDIDLGMIQKLSGLAQKSGIDHREQALLHALQAYLSPDRVTKLEKAMRAAKLAQLASSTLGQGGLQSLLGR